MFSWHKHYFALLILLVASQVCAPERKKHAAHTGAGGKKAASTNAQSGAVKEGMMIKLCLHWQKVVF